MTAPEVRKTLPAARWTVEIVPAPTPPDRNPPEATIAVVSCPEPMALAKMEVSACLPEPTAPEIRWMLPTVPEAMLPETTTPAPR